VASPEVETILDRTVGPTSYKRDDTLRRQIVAEFEATVGRMIEVAQAARAEVALIRPASNLKDCSPFKSEPGEGLTEADRAAARRHAEAAREYFADGLYHEARLELALDAFGFAPKLFRP
jgi:hypothetical protein